ncbi:MAG: PhzF family phenazine biosynthesis protein [Anaerocolumna sp.]|jgi:PhzF family phenazine biosynthesis protein|nr:PhzF family phenazine biosynthesis protein [Anaerocolumna sp.]
MDYYVVDVFTDDLFAGNSAGVCILDEWLSDDIMQKIAFENNLPETAFVVKRENYYDLRWFTPTVEIDLCGHATLGSTFVLSNYLDNSITQVEFHTKSGILSVQKDNELFTLDFPSRVPVSCQIPDILGKALGVNIVSTYQSRDLLILIESEKDVLNLKPNFELLKELNTVFGFIVTAKGETCDFVSRFFAPNAGINEDPVTGSSHCTLIPFWSEKLGKTKMLAKQLSNRGGTLYCENYGDRVHIGGRAVCYLKGQILL